VVPVGKRYRILLRFDNPHILRVWLAENWRRLSKFPHVSFVFPNAPQIPVTVNMGMRMPAWYDIISFNENERNADETGVMRSRSYLLNLIQEQEAKGIPSNRIALGGFSQGGAMSIFAGLTAKQKLAGIFSLSGCILLPEKFKALKDEEGGNVNSDTPVFLGHGESDTLMKYEWGTRTAGILKKNGWEVEFKSYPGMDHSVIPEEIDDLEKWLAARIPDEETKS
jgi:predicted esterase